MLGIFDIRRDANGIEVRLSRHGCHVLWALFWGLLIGAMAAASLVQYLEQLQEAP